ncbi:hypothetical protein GCM10018781_36770 [Kitasatospora indigofera]|uniref:Uncharacterized protein n=1 Tax=Kitasatospora indigofera TaxID=67307 RepID=A0A919KUQ6_9ACTN|nr:hypothetical protein GCM10018781_36770 [Kitasatospora indigofera]
MTVHPVSAVEPVFFTVTLAPKPPPHWLATAYVISQLPPAVGLVVAVGEPVAVGLVVAVGELVAVGLVEVVGVVVAVAEGEAVAVGLGGVLLVSPTMMPRPLVPT